MKIDNIYLNTYYPTRFQVFDKLGALIYDGMRDLTSDKTFD